jgi:hypothetical protein
MPLRIGGRRPATTCTAPNPDAPLRIQGHFRTARQLVAIGCPIAIAQAAGRSTQRKGWIDDSDDDGRRAPHRIGILRALLAVMMVGWGHGGCG